MITLYTKPNCPDCVYYKNYLKMKGVKYQEADIFAEDALTKINEAGIAGAPVIEIGDRLSIAKESNVLHIKSMLEEAGYL